MPRRPRPASRRTSQRAATSSVKAAHTATRAKPARGSRSKANHTQEESESDESAVAGSSSDGFFEEGASGLGTSGPEDEEDDLGGGESYVGEFDDAEPDAPRVAQWVDDEELDEEDVLEEASESSEDEEGTKSHLQASLRSLSFGALRKAQKALAKVSAVADSEEEERSAVSETEAESDGPVVRFDKGKEKEENIRPKKVVPKRKHKHAPMEMSSKRPVSRSRFVAEDKVVPRDPRFLPVTGEFDPKRFQNQYGFLSDLHQEELSTLRENLKRARKLLANSPRDLREERAAEVERLERAVKRAESAVNKDRREKVEMEALGKVAKEEREKRKQGKKAWFMKDADKKELLLRAKYDALAERGGRGAVRKAIEKKQKKVNQKEKKKIPFVPGQLSNTGSRSTWEGGPARLKRAHPGGDSGSRKRPRPN
ncbi:hypothetical protein BD310DRAFT_841291 [Dichomitus squalens]|uniref:rRNA biogenesis protein RRP36 n=1 Tax=Dichomitus squalens TaxID=114155 RepID=A0A4Q9QB59_9APHY|nr:hypothetical protein BD310DRAFT_841291 [Dichomitus squalens]